MRIVSLITLPCFAAGLLCGSLWGQTRVQTVFLSPNTVESKTVFQVVLSGKTALCNPRFSHFSALPGNGTLRLSMLAENDPAANCVAGDHDYSTEFPIPALPAGEYETELNLPPSCAYSSTPCPFAYISEYAGKLTVKDSADLNFAFRPKRAEAGKPFPLFLIGAHLPCSDRFTNLSSRVEGHSLYLQFTAQTLTDTTCPAVHKEYGPTYTLDAPAAGTYQVFASQLPYCGAGPCPALAILPQLAGALTVTEGTAPIRTDRKSGSPTGSGSRPGLRIGAHGATGIWKEQADDLAGRRKGKEGL